MKHDEIKIGEYYKLTYGEPLGEQLIFVVGRDPFSGKFVVSCDKWLNKVDLLEDDDFELMEKI